MNPYDFYKVQLPIRLHFISDSYDYFKFNGKTHFSKYDDFIRKKEFPLMRAMGARVTSAQSKDFCVAQYAADRDSFLFDGVEDAWSTYVEWEKKQNSLSYHLQTDLQLILSTNIILKTIRDGTLLQMVAQKKIQKETAIILDAVFAKFLDGWNKKYANDPYLITVVKRLVKYRPFVKFNKEKVVSVIGEEISVKQHEAF